MRPIYAPCTCKADDSIRPTGTVYVTPNTVAGELDAWAAYTHLWHCGAKPGDGCDAPGQCHWHDGRRYWVICSPRGHVVGVQS